MILFPMRDFFFSFARQRKGKGAIHDFNPVRSWTALKLGCSFRLTLPLLYLNSRITLPMKNWTGFSLLCTSSDRNVCSALQCLSAPLFKSQVMCGLIIWHKSLGGNQKCVWATWICRSNPIQPPDSSLVSLGPLQWPLTREKSGFLPRAQNRKKAASDLRLTSEGWLP